MLEVKSKYKMTELGEIPVDWEVYKLGRYVKLQGGYAFKSSKFSDKGIKILRISNIKEWGLYLNECKYYSDKDVVGLNDYYLKENDTVIAMSGATTGKSTLVKKSDLPLLVNQRVGTYKQKNEAKVDQKFIHYTVSSDYYQQKLWEHAIGGAQPNISSSQLESIVIAYPPLKEQQKIAEILSTVDEQIEQTDQLIEKTKELKNGLMQQLLTKGIGHTEFKQTELGNIPVEWGIASLKNLGTIFKGKGIAKKDLSDSGKKCILYGQLYTTYKEIISEVDTYTDIKIKNPVIGEKNDLLIPSSGETPIDIATASSLKVNEVYIGGDINVFRATDQINSDFLSYQINSVRKLELSNLAQGSSIYHLYKDNLEKFNVLVPPLKEQKEISKIISSVDEDINGYQQEKSTYEELKKGLMQQLLTGKTRVKVD